MVKTCCNALGTRTVMPWDLTSPLPSNHPPTAFVLDPNTPRSPKHQLAEQILTTGAPARVGGQVAHVCMHQGLWAADRGR